MSAWIGPQPFEEYHLGGHILVFPARQVGGPPDQLVLVHQFPDDAELPQEKIPAIALNLREAAALCAVLDGYVRHLEARDAEQSRREREGD